MEKSRINLNFLNLLFGQVVSQIGDKIYMLSLTFWVLDTTKSSTATGVVLFSSMAPSILVRLLFGGFVDRYNRKYIIIVADIIRGIIIGIISMLFFMGLLSIPIIIIAQILLSVCAAFFDTAVFAIIPTIVERDQLVKANAKSQLIDGITTIIGPMLGGVGIAYLGYGAIFISNAVSFLISAVFECFIKIPLKGNQNTEEQEKNKIKFIEGYRYLFKSKKLKIILAIVIIGHFIVGTLQIIMPVLSKVIKGNGAQNLGYIETTFGIGAALGSLLIIIINTNNKEEKLMFASIAIIGFSYVILGMVNILGITILLPYLGIILLFGATIIFAATCYQGVLQKEIDEDMRGRIYAIITSIGDSTIPVGILVYGILLDYIKLYWATIFLGIALIPLIILLYKKYKGTEVDIKSIDTLADLQ